MLRVLICYFFLLLLFIMLLLFVVLCLEIDFGRVGVVKSGSNEGVMEWFEVRIWESFGLCVGVVDGIVFVVLCVIGYEFVGWDSLKYCGVNKIWGKY